jgi:capsular polysaccharide biosynthesis protein
MSSQERLKLTLRRSAPLVLICMLIGVVALVGLTELEGSQYSASTQVLVTNPNLRSLLTGVSVPESETQSQGEVAAVLASSPGFFQYAAQSTQGSVWKKIQREVTVSQVGTSSVILFTVTVSSANQAVSLADRLAQDFPRYENSVDTVPIKQALHSAQLQRAIAPGNSHLRASIERLRLLETATTGGVKVGSAGSAEQIRPAVVRSVLEGATVGLVVGLLLMALREALEDGLSEAPDARSR